jgi:hypothetical protein
VKTDARDALHLARLLRLDEFTSVRVPAVAEEAARDLVRAREDVRSDLMRARHRVSKLLLRQGIIYAGGSTWTGPHHAWLAGQRFADAAVQGAYDASYDAVLMAEDRRARLDTAIAALARDPAWHPIVARLGCLRGRCPPAEALPPNNPSCGNQPAHISLDHASRTDTRTTGPRRPAPHEQPASGQHARTPARSAS